MSAAELRAIQRKLDRWELDHLREHAADLARQLDEMRALAADMQLRADDADERAEFWHSQAMDAFNYAQARGATIGLSRDGAIHLIGPPPTQ